MKELKFISPFKKLCITVGNLPTAYIESMSYYEGLTFLVNYLANNVIPAVNNNSEVVKELQDQFVILKNYVDNYFENLDVQEEINNKLDEMADSGQLTDIIAQYLGLAGMITFDTVADMKLAENLVDGSKCQTLGFNNYNDEGGAIYKVRRITNDDVIDERKIIELYDDYLIAELLVSNTIRVEQIGAAGDGVTDDTQAINYAIENFDNIIMRKNYYITDSLNIHNLSNKNINGLNSGKIFKTASEDNLSYIFDIIDGHNIIIQNLNLESESIYPTIPGQDHPNWNSSLSSNVTGFWIHNTACDNITIKNIKSKYLNFEANLNGQNDARMDNIIIENYEAVGNTRTAFYIGYTLNSTFNNVSVIADDLPLPATHFIYCGKGTGNININNCYFLGTQYHKSGLNFQDASFVPGSLSDDIDMNIRCNNTIINCPQPLRFMNDEIKGYFNNCEFYNIKQLKSDNTLVWNSFVNTAGVNNGDYYFNDCIFKQYNNEYIGEAADTFVSNGSGASVWNENITCNNCFISDIKCLNYYRSLTKNYTFNNCTMNISGNVVQRMNEDCKQILNNCYIEATGYCMASSGSNNMIYIFKNNYIYTSTSGGLIGLEGSNAIFKLFNNVIYAPNRLSSYYWGANTGNIYTNNDIVNETILTIS